MKYFDSVGLDEIHKINSIENPDKYLYFCHLKDEDFIDCVEVIDPINEETKMKENLPLITSDRTAEIGDFLHHFLYSGHSNN